VIPKPCMWRVCMCLQCMRCSQLHGALLCKLIAVQAQSQMTKKQPAAQVAALPPPPEPCNVHLWMCQLRASTLMLLFCCCNLRTLMFAVQ
jgi:hypothetical protein